MEDYRGDLGGRRKKLRSSISDLQGKRKKTQNPFQLQSIDEALGKLEQESLELDSMFLDDLGAADEEAPQEQFPYLNALWKQYDQLVKESRNVERDVRAAFLYMRYFEDEFLGIFSLRKLRLDVQYSVERDQFYDLFYRVQRSLENYRVEADRVADGTFAKGYETEILKRKVEMRHAMLVEVDWYFRKVKRFARTLLEDIDGERLLCQNPAEKLNYSTLDRETALRGKTVTEGLEELLRFSNETIAYVDVPDFQQREL